MMIQSPASPSYLPSLSAITPPLHSLLPSDTRRHLIRSNNTESLFLPDLFAPAFRNLAHLLAIIVGILFDCFCYTYYSPLAALLVYPNFYGHHLQRKKGKRAKILTFFCVWFYFVRALLSVRPFFQLRLLPNPVLD
ncbi:hypothetical protein K440DRAFT_264566 [Wilcoxina mikolae CBS 423.85]|nr:hypothetical protein K440DRAFT_264566 [Wilcoxina mikolae CBS 423.85]